MSTLMMEPRFVGALISDASGAVLMEHRTQAVGAFRGLWSLPGGRLEAGEPPIDALRRELREELGCEPTVGNELFLLERSRGVHVIYQASLTGVPRTSEPTFADTLEYFPPGTPPERSTIESTLALLKWANANGQLEISCGTLIDRLFSSVFYSYLYPILASDWPSTATRDLLLLTIERLPFRKFKASLPFLLTGCHHDAVTGAITAEVLFSTFYIFDDVCDLKTKRYGQATAFGELGSIRAATYLLAFPESLRQWLMTRTSAAEVYEAAGAGLAALCEAQRNRFAVGLHVTMSDYRRTSFERTRFLGEMWTLACAQAGAGDWAEIVRAVYERCAIAGQLKNDLRDFHADRDGGLEDVARGVVTAPTIRFLERCDATDRSWFEREVWARGHNAARSRRAEVLARFARYSVLESIRDDIDALATEVAAFVMEHSPLTPQRRVFCAWIELQLRTDHSEAAGGAELSDLIAAVETLTAGASVRTHYSTARLCGGHGEGRSA